MPYRILITLFFLLPFTCFAQSKITGRVLNISDKQPIANATVFLNNASIATSCNKDGSFTLSNVRLGQYEFSVSVVGYETYHQTILVNDDMKLGDIEIIPKSIALREVKIMSDAAREKYYQIFKERFLGTTENAKQCQIINPDILDIDYDNDNQVLTVKTEDFLVIENKALGYKLRYLLKSFKRDKQNNIISYDGSAIFENMQGSTSQQHRWQKNRLRVYEGSMKHFLRSMIADQMDDEGFRVLLLVRKSTDNPVEDSLAKHMLKKYRALALKNSKFNDSLFYWADIAHKPKISQNVIDTLLKSNQIIRLTDQKGIYAMSNPDCLYVMYSKNHRYAKDMKYQLTYTPDYPVTIITFKSPYAFFDNNGGVLNPESIFVEGSWGKDRIAESLPLDYDPNEGK